MPGKNLLGACPTCCEGFSARLLYAVREMSAAKGGFPVWHGRYDPEPVPVRRYLRVIPSGDLVFDDLPWHPDDRIEISGVAAMDPLLPSGCAGNANKIKAATHQVNNYCGDPGDYEDFGCWDWHTEQHVCMGIPAREFWVVTDLSDTVRRIRYGSVWNPNANEITYTLADEYTSAQLVADIKARLALYQPPVWPEVRLTVHAGGGVDGAQILQRGRFEELPDYWVSGGGGHGASVRLRYRIKAVRIEHPGGHYEAVPDLQVSGGGGTGAALTAVLGPTGRIEEVRVDNPGSGFSDLPGIDVVGGSVASPTLVPIMELDTAEVLAGGSGYVTAPQLHWCLPAKRPLLGAGDGLALASQVLSADESYASAATGVYQLAFQPLASGYAALRWVERIYDLSGEPLQRLEVIDPAAGMGWIVASLANSRVAFRFDEEIKEAVVLSPYDRYTSTPALTLPAPRPGSGGVQAQGRAIMAVDHLPLTNRGSGYTSAPEVMIAGGGGSGAAAVAEIDPQTGKIRAVRVTARGQGYTSVPTVSLIGGGGVGASVRVYMRLVGVEITQPGSGYNYALTISGGGGSGAQGSIQWDRDPTSSTYGQCTGAALSQAGSGYTSSPDVVVTAPPGAASPILAARFGSETEREHLWDGAVPDGYTSYHQTWPRTPIYPIPDLANNQGLEIALIRPAKS